MVAIISFGSKVKKNKMETGRIIYFVACVAIICFMGIRHILSDRKNKQEKLSEEQAPTETEDKETSELQFTLESVNSWLNNCDQKSSILLTVIGVAITVVLTSDFLKYLRCYIFAPFMQFCSGNSDLLFSWGRFTVFVFLIIAVALLVTSCIYLFRAVRANIEYEKMYRMNPGLVKTSYIFYGTISQMKYDDFKKGGVEFKEDLKSQIYVNSQIAITKFKNYNEGLFWFKLLLLDTVMLFVAVMFVQ